MSEDLRLSAAGFAAGSKVGRYALEEQIGHGGMAAVFKARDTGLGRVVALKIMAPALAADQAFRQRFIRESRAAAAVDDPHIIPLYEAGDADGALFIAMRYVPGGDVRALLHREGPLPAERVAAIVAPVASALDAAHAAGLVHRDVKPANMLLDARPGRPDHVYLSDFGLSKDAAVSTSLTGTGSFVGTVDYAAPEQISGRPVDGRTDQYALGCAAFEMLCGEPPFRRDHGMAVIAAHMSQLPPRLSAKRAGLPPAVDAVFARVLAKRADDRYRTCGEFSDALRDALWLGRRQARRWPLAVAAAAVAAIVATAAIIFAARSNPSSSPPAAGSTKTTPPSSTPQASWTPHQAAGEFTIDLPPGWAVISSGSSQVTFGGSPPGFIVVVAWTRSPKPDAATDWMHQSAAKAAADSSYHLISIRHVSYRGYDAADWEFTDTYRATLNQFVDRGFVVHPGTLGFAIELYGPLAQFRSVYVSMWHKLVTSFEPAS